MRYLRIGDIGRVVSGSTPRTDNEEYWDGNIPWVTPKEISKLETQYLNDTERKITEIGLKSCSTSIIPKGSILFTSRAPIGLVAINNLDVCTNQGFKSIIPNKDVHALYIYYVLLANAKKLDRLGTGTTFRELSKSTFEKFEIPVPELPDQIRIATVLSKAEALFAQRKESIQLLDELLKSTFLEMFGDPVKNEKGWEKDKVEKYTDCIVPGRDKPKSFTGSIPWIRTEDLVNRGFINKSNENIGLSIEEIQEVNGKIIPIGSVLMTCVGQLNVISINTSECIINQQLHSFQCKNTINNVFLMFSIGFQGRFMYNNASTTTVAYMNKTICNSIPTILPPIELQIQFAHIVEKVEALKSQYSASLHELENLYGSLSQKAFKGELDLGKIDIEPETLNVLNSEIDKTENFEKEIQNILEVANSITHHFEKVKDLSKEVKRFNVYFEKWDEVISPFLKLPKPPIAIIKAIEQVKLIKAAFFNIEPHEYKKSEKLIWEQVSFEQMANWIREKYSGYHFSFEMLTRFLVDEYVTSPNYFSSEELKKNPKLVESDDLKSFVFSAIRKENKYLELDQLFYDAEKDDLILKTTREDFELIQNRTKEQRSGIYFCII